MNDPCSPIVFLGKEPNDIFVPKRDAIALVDGSDLLEYRIRRKEYKTYVRNSNSPLPIQKEHCQLKENDEVYISLNQMWQFVYEHNDNREARRIIEYRDAVLKKTNS